ncbi:hypothetical protein BGX30_001363 [Mortierella sp. GBA39]|nr:hypothetical protein BGX30_001363 [Mortierella sp. GBA39]
MPPVKATSSANTTVAVKTTNRTIASGQNGRQEPRDDHDNYDNDIPEDEHGNGDYMDDNNHRGDEMEEQQDNPLIHLTQNQREAAVENLEIETMDRIQKLRASIGVLTNSLKFRAEAEVNRLPAAIRTMTVEEFWFTYNGSAKEYLEQQAKSKSVANTAFLHALGMVDHKRKRETPGPTDDLWQQTKKNRDEQRQDPVQDVNDTME